MNQLTHQVERHHLPQLIYRCHPEQPSHDHFFITNNHSTLKRSFLKDGLCV